MIEEVGHDFRGMQVKLSCTIGNVLFLLIQQYGRVCVGVYFVYGERDVIKIRDQPPLSW